jgi:hypothetical protein
MRHKSGFAPAGMCYDPITATLMVASLAMSGMSIAANNKNAKAQANAVAQEGALRAQERAKQTKMLAAKQKTSFLNSGISLTGEGTPQAMLDDTYNTGLADIGQIKSNANTQSKNIMAQARSQMFSTLGSMGMSVAGGMQSSGMFSGTKTTGSVDTSSGYGTNLEAAFLS